MMRIGIVDYYLSEWHANNYPAWLVKAGESLAIEAKVTVAWAEKEISPVDGVSTDAWCEKNGVLRADSIESLCESCDAIMILAPSDPDKHLQYAKQVLPYGKPTFIDKTFAPDLATAQEIFMLAERYGTPIFSSSALRFAQELLTFENVRNLIVTAGGSNAEEYLVHPLEMAISLLGDRVERVWVDRQGEQLLCHAETESGKQATVVFAQRLPYTVATEDGEGKSGYAPIKSDFFGGLMKTALRFFADGKPPFDPAETLEIMRVRDAILAQIVNDLHF